MNAFLKEQKKNSVDAVLDIIMLLMARAQDVRFFARSIGWTKIRDNREMYDIEWARGVVDCANDDIMCHGFELRECCRFRLHK